MIANPSLEDQVIRAAREVERLSQQGAPTRDAHRRLDELRAEQDRVRIAVAKC